ncbi:unnamed protein product [Spirodela intermedia]|uniref:DYW domain-containing protein n=1 Tax=Spirodela intermedia TaxID=51605 RepID=A0A7I8JKR1_SPIIN|nr:unnamed protein product [Spirodela intermedia]CAA6670062.1 unnamed protein product [Spirodela intermedia]
MHLLLRLPPAAPRSSYHPPLSPHPLPPPPLRPFLRRPWPPSPCPPSPRPLRRRRRRPSRHLERPPPAHSKSPSSAEAAILLFRRLLAGECPAAPDKYSFTFAIAASSRGPSPAAGEALHSLAVIAGVLSDVFVGNSLINMYSAFGNTDDAQRMFDEMPLRDVAEAVFQEMPRRNEVSWAAMVSGYVKAARFSDALRCFRVLLRGEEAEPNEAVLVSVLSACAQSGALEQGKWVHAFIRRSGSPVSSAIATALVEMYSRCGDIECARQVFDSVPRRGLPVWTSMVSGLALHGCGGAAVELFRRMLDEGVKPDDVALLGVLNACSHSGLVEEGCAIFDNMVSSWGISPKVEHYGCLVDLLGRAGRLRRALEVAASMPVEPDAAIWRSLLSACRIHGDVRLAELVASRLACYPPAERGGSLVLLSNLYASARQWDEAASVRKKMAAVEGEGTVPGCSLIEIDGAVHEFLATDRRHPCIITIRAKLGEVLARVRAEGGYAVDTSGVTFDLEDEDKEEAVAGHSEKLAVAFGLMSLQPGGPMRIVKNLRICEDCHSAMKAISLVFHREILVRDKARFHAFSSGCCSCGDYW